MLTRQVEAVRKSFVFCSFSTRSDSTSMWSHYANNHRGFCVEYDVEPISSIPVLRDAFFPVQYDEHMVDITEALVAQWMDGSSIDALSIGLRKATDWSYENEWRLLFRKTFLTPQLMAFPGLKRVLLGTHFVVTEGSLSAELLKLCDEKGIPAVRMQQDSERFLVRPES